MTDQSNTVEIDSGQKASYSPVIMTEERVARDVEKSTLSDKYKKLLWKQFLASNPGPNNIQLCQLVIQSEPLRELALQLLVQKKPQPDELYWLIREGTPAVKRTAFDMLVAQLDDAYKYLVSIVIQVEDYRAEAWQHLMKLNPKGRELRLIADYCPTLKYNCWKIILGQEITNYELMVIMRTYPDLRDAAFTKMLAGYYTHYDLCLVIETLPELRTKAWKQLLREGATNTDLNYLIERVPPIRKSAEYRLYKETEDVLGSLRGYY